MNRILQQALQLASNRGLLPSALSAQETADLAATMDSRLFWSARTTQASYLAELKKIVERYTSGEGFENDLASLRLELRRLLKAYGYAPERGFPGDAARGVPSATPGTLTDLGSERRLNLILDTQAKLSRGLGQKMRGQARISTFPAWELIRVETRATPREWEERWKIAADNVDSAGVYEVEGRFIAHKESPMWAALGSRALFDDALDVDHAPFAFGSGMGLRETSVSDLNGAVMTPLSEAPSLAISKPSAEVPDYIDPDDFIGGQKTVDNLLAKWRSRPR